MSRFKFVLVYGYKSYKKCLILMLPIDKVEGFGRAINVLVLTFFNQNYCGNWCSHKWRLGSIESIILQ